MEPEAARGEALKAASCCKRNAAVFVAVAAVWLAVDLLTKAYFDGFAPGEVVAGPFLGLFRFKLVHNTGMAWGMFSDSTLALGVMSLLVCVVLALYLLVLSPRASLAQALGVALVVAGGIGNAIDRFSQGYVVDFIDLAFMDFPVFNVADIGVTCGFVLFLVALVVEWRHEDALRAKEGSGGAEGCREACVPVQEPGEGTMEAGQAVTPDAGGTTPGATSGTECGQAAASDADGATCGNDGSVGPDGQGPRG